MGNTWVTNMLHSLDEDGEVTVPPALIHSETLPCGPNFPCAFFGS